jgi:hypothetical protein
MTTKQHKPALTPHVTKKLRGLPWVFCRFCGLVYLNNEPTREAIRRGCDKT